MGEGVGLDPSMGVPVAIGFGDEGAASYPHPASANAIKNKRSLLN